MTPQDFLDSVVEQEPRRKFTFFRHANYSTYYLPWPSFVARLKRRILTLDDINKFKDVTPVLKKGSSQMFRNLRDKGIISYTEYLFLLSILTSTYAPCILMVKSNSNHGMPCIHSPVFVVAEPKSGFQIAFNMFDTDGNQRVDKNEFLVVSKWFICKRNVYCHRLSLISSNYLDSAQYTFVSKYSHVLCHPPCPFPFHNPGRLLVSSADL